MGDEIRVHCRLEAGRWSIEHVGRRWGEESGLSHMRDVDRRVEGDALGDAFVRRPSRDFRHELLWRMRRGSLLHRTGVEH